VSVDHAGIATADADSLVEQYTALFDCSVAHEEGFDGMDIRFLDLGNCYFEIIEPLADGAIASYLDRNGPGIHHLAVETDDIEKRLNTAQELGIDLIDEQPREGAWSHEVAFLHPGSTGGVLVEFVEH
jgi:methylmalonyl-CoA/ethylmalonyl-CoA epimerase